MHIDDLVPDKRLEEDADETDQPVLHVPALLTILQPHYSVCSLNLNLMCHSLVLDRLTGGDAVRDVKVDELCWQLHCRGQPVQ